jgi:hypothetical protein
MRFGSIFLTAEGAENTERVVSELGHLLSAISAFSAAKKLGTTGLGPNRNTRKHLYGLLSTKPPTDGISRADPKPPSAAKT